MTLTRTRRPAPATPGLQAHAKARAKAERSARRSRVLRRTGNSLAVLLPLLAVGWVLLASDWLGVDRVDVRGLDRLRAAQVVEAAAVEPGTPLARVDSRAVEARVSGLAPVAKVTVRRTWPGTLTVEVTERVPVAGVVQPGGVRLVDAAGVPFATEPSQPKGLIRLQVARPGPDDPATRVALQVHAALPPPLRERVGIVQADSPASVVLHLYDGRRIVWGGLGNTATKAAAALALLTKPGSSYDVSAGDVVVVK